MIANEYNLNGNDPENDVISNGHDPDWTQSELALAFTCKVAN